MPDQPTAATTTEPCPQCDDRRVVPRLYDSGRRYTRGARIRAAALVASYLPVPELGYWQWYAAVVLIRVLLPK